MNSFLQSEISNIAGKALDINVGMETVDDADSGGKRTDYNFQFAKRFWNNRFRIVVGGKVSTGSTVQQDETFIDNVSIEYRLDNSGTRYVKLFHDKNYESVLEGEIIETGVGIVLRKKMSHLGELFIFKSKKKKMIVGDMERKHNINLFLLSVLLLMTVACSTTRNLPEDETLYVGVKNMEILNEDKTPAGVQTLEEVEAALSYPPNNAILGSNSLRFPIPFRFVDITMIL